eukprot:gene14719-14887_t
MDAGNYDELPLRVGCALLPKKVSRYLTPRMLEVACQHNIQLIQIEYTRPLLQQGPFHIIIHKLRPNPEWEAYLQQYMAVHPEVTVIDRLDRIKALHNRATMLRPLQGDGISLLRVEILEGASEADAQAALAAAGLSPPLLCKPLWTDGREGSHGLAVLHDLEALGRLLRGAVSREFKPPLVVQQFVEHGGVLFKVYVLGEQTLFNFDLIVPEEQLPHGEADVAGRDGTLSSSSSSQRREGAAPALCYVVDINYFPGVDKIPNFEERFVAFLRAAAAQGQQSTSWRAPPAAAAQTCLAEQQQWKPEEEHLSFAAAAATDLPQEGSSHAQLSAHRSSSFPQQQQQ